MSGGLPIARASATPEQRPVRASEALAMLIDVTTCIGCKACEVACVEWNDLHVEPETATRTLDSYQTMPDMTPTFWNLIRFDEIGVDEQKRPLLPEAASDGPGVMLLMRKDMCMHCAEPGCLAACPSEGAIVQYANGVVDFVHEACIGCGYCMTGCPFDVPKFDPATQRVYKCTMCSDRLENGLGPACVKACPTQCLQFGTKAEMLGLAEQRVLQLREGGLSQAGLYDPGGVGGTGVVYVLHHADQPELYGGLPKDPRVEPAIRFWKGPMKGAGNALLGASLAASALHYLGTGPVRVPEAQGERQIQRYTLGERLVHWVVALSFLYLALTGLGLWSPALDFLLAVFGGGQLVRAWHPIVGCVFVAAVLVQASRWIRDLLPEPGDGAFLRRMGAYLSGRHDEVPPSGRFNAGQKLLFGSQVLLALLLFASGLALWWPELSGRSWRLAALVLHPASAVLALLSLVVHLHMALLITRGALRAMTEGRVSESWARYHHGRWAEKRLGPK